MAASFNHRYGSHFVLPQAAIEESVATLPGLDGRKMSKSYDNTIPLFVPRDQLKKLVMGLLTDSRAPGEPKSTEGSALFQIYQAFASAEETAAMRQAFADGIAWGEAKQQLFERLDAEIAPMRAAYGHYMAHPEEVERILLAGAAKARAIATPFTQKLRHAVGLRHLSGKHLHLELNDSVISTDKVSVIKHKPKLATFKQYREKDGLFYFKLADAAGGLMLQSTGFPDPVQCGYAIVRLRAEGAAALADLGQSLQPGVATDTLDAAMAALRDAKS
jgi:tryptophanyl-tRNA synthetase